MGEEKDKRAEVKKRGDVRTRWGNREEEKSVGRGKRGQEKGS